MRTSPLLLSPRRSFLLAREFDVADGEGTLLGRIVGTGVKLELSDSSGALVASFERPWVLFRTEVFVSDAAGERIGGVRQGSPLGRIRVAFFDEQGERGAWEPDGFGAAVFRLLDTDGMEAGTLRRQMAFLLRTGDYELSFGRDADPELRLLAIGGVLAIDKAIRRRRSGAGSGGA